MLLIKLSFLDKCYFCLLYVGPVGMVLVGCLVKTDMVIKNACAERCQERVVNLMLALKYSGAV